MAMIYCKECGAKYSDKAMSCPKCGYTEGVSNNKSIVAYVLLAFFIGCFGAHKFYIGKNGQGVAMLLMCTIGWLLIIPGVIACIWAFVDFIIGLCNLSTPDKILGNK